MRQLSAAFICLACLSLAPAYAQTKQRPNLEAILSKPPLITDQDTLFAGLKIRSITYGVGYGFINIQSELPAYAGATMVMSGCLDDGYFTSIQLRLTNDSIINLYQQHERSYFFVKDHARRTESEPESPEQAEEALCEVHCIPKSPIYNIYTYNLGPVTYEAFLAKLLVGLRVLVGRAYTFTGQFSTQPDALCLDVEALGAPIVAAKYLKEKMPGKGKGMRALSTPKHYDIDGESAPGFVRLVSNK